MAFGAASGLTDPVDRVLPLHFAPVGCVALADQPRASGVLLIPVVEDLMANSLTSSGRGPDAAAMSAR